MKFPPLGTAEILESVRVTPMKSAAWQALQDPDARDRDPEADRFLWDGIFRSNPAFTGTWKTVGFVSSPDAFDAAKPKEPQRAPLQAIRFESDGATQDPLWIWSGSTLMNLRKNEALAMSVAKRGDTDYLFVEAGGFDVKHGNDWKSPWFVMKREP